MRRLNRLVFSLWRLIKAQLKWKLGSIIKARIQCNYSNRVTWKKIIQSQRLFLKQKILNFFWKGPLKFKVQLWRTFKKFNIEPRLNLPRLSGSSPQNFWCYWSVCKKPWESFALKKHCDWRIHFPGSSSRTEILLANNVSLNPGSRSAPWTSVKNFRRLALLSRISSIIPPVGGFLTGIHFTPNVNGNLHDLVFRRRNALNAQLNAPTTAKT